MFPASPGSISWRRAIFRGAAPQLGVSRSGYTGEDGFEMSLPAEAARRPRRPLLLEDEVEPIGLGARDSLRLEAGLCLYGHDIDTTTSPVEAGLVWSISRRRREAGRFSRRRARPARTGRRRDPPARRPGPRGQGAGARGRGNHRCGRRGHRQGHVGRLRAFARTARRHGLCSARIRARGNRPST